ncbi:hypothetical protein BDM02DRAFT_3116521 [Thelephora ganbajun]|uniref:Uncharacterized protein n=1 Tax=Thelephora ganbajun TaxID=370292 RepID=A0ACB6ZEH5_THEGA|nr:hypothetical protein BDM02DRAFT_3116521 [Thelephora ganbajun]
MVLTYRDIAHTNAYGPIRGLQFPAFVFQYYRLVMDLLGSASSVPARWLVPLKCLIVSSGTAILPPRFVILSVSTPATSISYTSCFTAEEARDLIRGYLSQGVSGHHFSPPCDTSALYSPYRPCASGGGTQGQKTQVRNGITFSPTSKRKG